MNASATPHGDADDDISRAPSADSSVIGSSAVMAVGTTLSKVSGMVRDIAIVAAVGLGVFADAYSVANTVPNIIYILIAGGALNAIFVPQLVRAMARDEDGGEEYAQRLLTIVALLLLGVTIVAVLLAPWLVRLYSSSSWSEDDLSVATAFARFCLPQILFYGLFTMFSQVLNARGHFAMPMFAPIVNNVVVVATALLFIGVTTNDGLTTASVTGGEIALLGLGTTLGIVIQALVLVPVMARTGFRWRPRFGVRGHGLGKAGNLASWTFVFVLTNQLAYIVITRLATGANKLAEDNGALAAGFTSYTKAYLLFFLPHSIITVSIVTALLPRMSRSAAAGRLAAVAADVGGGARLVLAALVPAMVGLFVLGPNLALVLFGFGNAGIDDARFIGVVLQAFVIGLLPFTLFYVLLRGFYALEDTKTPALINIGMSIINVVAALGLFALAPLELKVPALALGYALSFLVTVPYTWHVLSRRLGPDGLPTYLVVRTLVRLLICGALTGVLMVAIELGTSAVLGEGRVAAFISIVLAGLIGGAAYVVLAQRLRVTEVSQVISGVTARVRRG